MLRAHDVRTRPGRWRMPASAKAGALFAAFGMYATGAAAETAGAEVYQDHCVQCHVLSGTGMAPSLVGVVGRKAASLPGYPYSAGLKKSTLTWTAANLDRFLAAPTQLAPGTTMRATLPNPADRKTLIAYLATLKR